MGIHLESGQSASAHLWSFPSAPKLILWNTLARSWTPPTATRATIGLSLSEAKSVAASTAAKRSPPPMSSGGSRKEAGQPFALDAVLIP